MKIALIAPTDETVPPIGYGGAEWVVARLANGLGQRGHQVDLYAAGNSPKSEVYQLIPITEKNLRSNSAVFDDNAVRHVTKLTDLGSIISTINDHQYDVIHNNIDWRFLLFADFVTTPIVTTHHKPLTIAYQNCIFLDHRELPYVAISNNQRRELPELNFVATVYNGVNLIDFPFISNPQRDNMIFFARISPEKGAVVAAKIAHQTNRTLIAAGIVDPIDKQYFQSFQPLIDNKLVSFVGPVDAVKRAELLGNAKCLIAPINWEEPFGLMFTEAMACGTPVVAFARGSVPEIIQDGVTGFIVNSSEADKRGDWVIKKTGIEGLTEAIERIYALPSDDYDTMRKASRTLVEQKFSVEQMVEHYEQVYQQIRK